MEWYYSQNEQTVGPFDGATLQKLLKAGVITKETLVFNSQLPGWVPLGACMLPPDPSVHPETPKSEPQVPGAAVPLLGQKFPCKSLYAIVCIVMTFVIPVVRTHHHWVVILLILGFAAGAVELSHLGIRDVKQGRASHKHRHLARITLVCSYLVLTLMIAILIVGFVTAR